MMNPIDPVLVREYPGLAQIHGSYLHQDFMREFSSAADAVRTFAKEEPPELVQSAADEIARLLQDERFQRSPDSVLSGFGCYYLPTADGFSYLDWIMKVRWILQEE